MYLLLKPNMKIGSNLGSFPLTKHVFGGGGNTEISMVELNQFLLAVKQCCPVLYLTNLTTVLPSPPVLSPSSSCSLPFLSHPGSLSPLQLEYDRKKKEEGKRARVDKQQVLDMLFSAFEKHQYYNIKDLVDITKQPVVSTPIS